MVRKLETGGYLLERDRQATPPNRLRAIDPAATARHEANKLALLRKLK